MFRQYLRILNRSISKNPLYAFVNFTGLTLSLAASLLIYLWIYDELSFDKMHKDHHRIYRALTLKKEGTDFVKTPELPLPLAEFLRDEYAQVETATFIKYEMETPLQIGDKKIEVVPAYIDPHFFEVFSGYTFIEGSMENALSDPRSIVLSEKTARILFGNEKALGQLLESNKFNLTDIYKVAGVVKIPKHSHIDFGFATLIDNNNLLQRLYTLNWKEGSWSSVYFKLRKNAEVSTDFIASINEHYSRQTGKPKRVLYQPLANIHLYSDYSWQFDRNLGEIKYILIFTGLALAILTLAIFNFVLLTIARASERFKEIAYRKIVGASRSQLLTQYMLETFSQMLVAMTAGLFLAYILLPWFNQLTDKSIYFIPSFNFIAATLILALLISVIAGIYPSTYLSSFNPLLIFKGGTTSGSKNILIKTLITLQSVASICLLILTIMVYKQIMYIERADLGLTKENIVIIPTGLWYDNAAFKGELLQNTNIVSATFSTQPPTSFFNQIPLSINGLDSVFATLYWVDKDFAKTYDLEIIEGEFLKTTNEEYLSRMLERKDSLETHMISTPMVINETARDMLDLDDPIGARIGDKVIVGVVKDFHLRSFEYKIGPVVMVNNPENIMTLNVKINPERKSETIDYIRDVYAKHRADRGFSYSYFEETLATLYNREKSLAGILLHGTIIAFVISLMGTFSLSSFSANRRRREIGIRKVHGADTVDVMVMLNVDLLKWVLVALIPAVPLGIYLSHQWLQNYAYRTNISWWLIVIIGLYTLFAAFVSISWRCWKAAEENPVDILRAE